jgi:MFS family permease
MARDVVVRPSGTSWGAVLDGWLATVGVAAILTPIVGILLSTWYSTRGYASTIPVLVAVGLAYLIGGYIAGRIAGYRTSWHGMVVAFFGLFVVLALLVIDIALAQGVFGQSSRLVPILPLVLGVALFQSVETFAFGGAIAILLAIFAAWLGGLLAPERLGVAVSPAATDAPIAEPASVPVITPIVREREVATTRRAPRARERYRLLPSPARKGGERMDDVDEVDDADEVEPVETTDRVQPS